MINYRYYLSHDINKDIIYDEEQNNFCVTITSNE